MKRRYLRRGSRGKAVRHLQRCLRSHGVGVAVDGAFGVYTETGVKAFQANRGLVVDGVVGPKTWDALEDSATFVPPTLSGVPTVADEAPTVADADDLPKGLGMFVSGMTKATVGTPGDMVTTCLETGIRWIAILAVWQDGAGQRRWNHGAHVAKYVDALHDAGVDVFVWAWTAPGMQHEGLEVVRGRVDAWSAKGVILDVEEQYRGQFSAAHDLVADARDTFSDVSVGFSSYAASGVPFEVFAGLDFAIPQIYDSENNLGADYAADALVSWRQKVGACPLIPAFKTYNSTPHTIETAIARIGVYHLAIVGWQWRTTSAEEFGAIAIATNRGRNVGWRRPDSTSGG